MLHTSRTTAFDANNYAGLSYKIMNEVTALMRYSCYGHPGRPLIAEVIPGFLTSTVGKALIVAFRWY